MVLSAIDLIEKRKELWEEYSNIEKDREYTQAISEYLITDEAKSLRREIQDDPSLVIEIFFCIVNKEQETVPFFLNTIQLKFKNVLNQAIQDYKDKKRNHLKFLVLKGRQQGFTSYITAYQLACTITMPNFSGFTVADSSDNTNTIFTDKAKYPYSQLPDILKPVEQTNNRTELLFSNLNSKWRVATAGNKDIGRSKIVNFFHGSEAAFWKSIHLIISGLGQALTKDSIQILETTANGMNEYREFWREAEQGDNNWTPLFFEWWETPEYELPFGSDNERIEFQKCIDSQETKFYRKCFWLQTEKHLTLEQLNWYQAKQKDLKELLDQEYPCTPLEAFLTSGNPVFNAEIVLNRILHLEKEYEHRKLRTGYFKYKYENQMIINETIEFVDSPTGWLTIYEEPMPGYHYVIGADTADGGSDSNTGQVLNNHTGEQATVFKAKMDTDLFAKQLYCLGKYYNGALLGPEVNFDSHPVKELQRLDYKNMYVRQKIDSIGEEVIMKYGFNTNVATRPVIIGDLVEIARDSIELIKDIPTLKEMLVFVNIDGKPQAVIGEHDDLVMGLAIAYYIRSQEKTTIDIKTEQKDFEPEALKTNNNKGGSYSWNVNY